MASVAAPLRWSPKRTPLAWRNILHYKTTSAISLGAIAFAVVIMFMELGFLNGLYDSQTGVLEFFRADLVMVNRALHIFNTHETFSRTRLEQVAGIPGVKGAYPIYVEDVSSYLRNPETGIRHAVRVIGFNLRDPVFHTPEINRLIDRLRTPLTILFDARSRSFLGTFRAGTSTELANRAVTVAGTFPLGPDYYYDGNVITETDTFFTLFPSERRSRVFIGLIQLEDGASADATLRELQAIIGPDVEVMTKADIVRREKGKWQKSTPAGYIFTMGVAVGFIIGVFICYQILYTDIRDHLPQLATMKALGYPDRALVQLVLTQAALLGMLGFVPALAMTLGIYSVLTIATGIITKLTIARAVLVFVLTLGMAFVAGLLAVRKALAIDPAELF